jgi:hypothetical protein
MSSDMRNMPGIPKLFYPLLFFLLTFPLFSQDENIKYPIGEIEKMLAYDPVELAIPRDVRFKGDKAKTAVLKRDDGFFIRVKLKKAAQGGEDYNNQPRYEIAAYQLQKLFLDPDEYVVPPTAGRGFSLEAYREIEEGAQPTFKNTAAVFCLLQYWLDNVTTKNLFDEKRFYSDSLYARNIGNLNIFTYLIRHSDSNVGNFLISNVPENPRLFAVDNEMAFGDIMSERGYEWRNLMVNRFPQKTVDRLRQIQEEDLFETLSVVAQYEIRESQLIPVATTANLDENKGVRQSDGIIQLGLTVKEINRIFERLQDFLQKVDSGDISTF